MHERGYEEYLEILKRELVPALGCTEPIALAYLGAVASQMLGCIPERIEIACSGNLIKNVKSVTVPSSNGMRGIEAAVILGAVGGKAELQLEVLSEIKPEHIETAKKMLEKNCCKVKYLESNSTLHAICEAFAGEHTVRIELKDTHTNIVSIKKDNHVVFIKKEIENVTTEKESVVKILDFDSILDFADRTPAEALRPILKRQIQYNMQIAEEGLKNDYGACVGQTLLKNSNKADIKTIAKAYAAAGSDARMSGCSMPVIINSGSGNQGITASLPVIKFAEYANIGEEKLLKALAVSNLVTIWQKQRLGSLSAFCGAVCAAGGSGAGIAYIMGCGREVIKKTVINTLANVEGIVCDGAKSSCAAKIASSLDAAFLGMQMAVSGKGFRPGEGMVKSDIDETMETIMEMGREGMKETDKKILELMVS